MAHHIGSASGRLLLRPRTYTWGRAPTSSGTNRARRFPTSRFTQIGNNGKRSISEPAVAARGDTEYTGSAALIFVQIEHQVPRVAIVFRSTRDNLGCIDNEPPPAQRAPYRSRALYHRRAPSRTDSMRGFGSACLKAPPHANPHHENRRGLVIQAALLNGARRHRRAAHSRAAFRKFAQMRDLALLK